MKIQKNYKLDEFHVNTVAILAEYSKKSNTAVLEDAIALLAAISASYSHEDEFFVPKHSYEIFALTYAKAYKAFTQDMLRKAEAKRLATQAQAQAPKKSSSTTVKKSKSVKVPKPTSTTVKKEDKQW